MVSSFLVSSMIQYVFLYFTSSISKYTFYFVLFFYFMKFNYIVNNYLLCTISIADNMRWNLNRSGVITLASQVSICRLLYEVRTYSIVYSTISNMKTTGFSTFSLSEDTSTDFIFSFIPNAFCNSYNLPPEHLSKYVSMFGGGVVNFPSLARL